MAEPAGEHAQNRPGTIHEQRSLFGEILDWLIAPLLLLWPMSLGVTWLVAQSIASRPYDRELADVVRALARQATQQAAIVDAPTASLQQTRLALDRTAAALKRGDDDDRTYYQVRGRHGELLAGQAELTAPDEHGAPSAGAVRFRDDLIGDEPVRVAYLWLDPDPAANAQGGALVQVAETTGKRSELATEIIKGLILPQFVILPLAVVLVWFALARGIRPLAELQQRIRQRESSDLSAIAEGDVPDEVAPLVRAINDLLLRLDHSIATQRHFLADAAHQLKTPLAGLRMQAELAAREIDSGRGDAASLKHTLQQISLSTQRAARMVNQLLALARAEDAGQALRREVVDLAEITRAVVRDFVPRAIERHIDLGFEGPEPADREPGQAPRAHVADGRAGADQRDGAQSRRQRPAVHPAGWHSHGARAVGSDGARRGAAGRGHRAGHRRDSSRNARPSSGPSTAPRTRRSTAAGWAWRSSRK